MMTVQFVSGISLFALLIVDICCYPVNKGYNPNASHGSSYTNADPNYNFYQGVPPGQYPPGAVRPYNAPSNGFATKYYQAVPQPAPSVPQPGPSVPQPAVQTGPAPSVDSPGPVSSGGSGAAVRPNPASSAQPGADFQPGPQGWAAAPPSHFSGGEEMATGTRTLVPSQPINTSPYEPMYQAGELSHYEKSFEHSDSERETEEQGSLPMPPPPPPFSMGQSAGQSFPSRPRPNFYIGSWGPYPFYDHMFLTGEYPPGTITHASSSYEQGRDHWQDVHYVRDYAPYDPAPAQQTETFTGDFEAPESLEDAQDEAEAGSGQGGAQDGAEAVSGQDGAEADSEQGGVQDGAEADSEQGGAQAGSGQDGAEADSGPGGAQAGSGQGGAHAGFLAPYGGYWLPVYHQAGRYNLGKVSY